MWNHKFSLPWQNKGQSRAHFNDTVKLPTFESPLIGASFSTISLISTSL